MARPAALGEQRCVLPAWSYLVASAMCVCLGIGQILGNTQQFWGGFADWVVGEGVQGGSGVVHSM